MKHSIEYPLEHVKQILEKLGVLHINIEKTTIILRRTMRLKFSIIYSSGKSTNN